MDIKVSFEYRKKKYEFTRNSKNFDRNYDDENYAYFLEVNDDKLEEGDENWLGFEITVWQDDDCETFSKEASINIYHKSWDDRRYECPSGEIKVEFLDTSYGELIELEKEFEEQLIRLGYTFEDEELKIQAFHDFCAQYEDGLEPLVSLPS